MKSKNPPKWAIRFLSWFCRQDLSDAVSGDLLELHARRIEKLGKWKADWLFVWNVLLFLQPFALKQKVKNSNKLNFTTMLLHNLLLAYRNFKRYKSSFFINLIGLSTGLACVLLIFLWVSDALRVDRFHENKHQLYQVMEHVEQAGGIITRQTTAGPTGAALVDEMPEVLSSVTTTTKRIIDYTLSVGNNDIKAKGFYASADYFKLFSYEFIKGDKNQVLSDKKAIVISESLALRLFGTLENVIGKVVEWQHDKEYKVSGIFKNIPSYSSVQFDFVLSFKGFRDDNEWVTSWYNTAPQTYLLIKSGTDIDQFNDKIADLIRTKTDGRASHRSPFITRYSDAYLYNRYENGVQTGGRIEYVRLFSMIALFILFIACINFMNLSTARASRRIKEVGMKKVLGAPRRALVFQYLGESTFMAVLSLVFALIFVALFLPQFNIITDKQLTLDLNLDVVLFLLAIVLITGLVAGSYPALFLSGFNPNAVLRGKLTGIISRLWARKGLVVFQFTLSIILILSVWVVYKQIEFVQTKNLGYEKDNILLFGKEGLLRETEKLSTFLKETRNLRGIADASSIGHDMTGHNGGTYGVQWPGKNPDDKTEFENVSVNYGMIEMLGIKIKEGRTFSEDFGAETEKIIFNEAAIEFMGLTDPIGKVIKLWREDREIVGVVKDFHFDSFHEEVKPLFFRLRPEHTNYIMARIEEGMEQEAIDNLQQFYQIYNPGFPLNYWFLDEDYQALYAAEQRVSILSRYFAALAILISCLGLFGLAAFTAERRTREIGIRKILGSSEFGIVYLLSGDFTKMVLIAIFVALPLSYFITQRWLESFAFHIDLEWWFFVATALLALLIAWLTVGVQTVKAAKTNPVQCLKDE